MKTRDYQEEFTLFLKQYNIYDAFVSALYNAKKITLEQFMDEYVAAVSEWTTCCFTWSNNPGVNWPEYHRIWNDYLNPKFKEVMIIETPVI